MICPATQQSEVNLLLSRPYSQLFASSPAAVFDTQLFDTSVHVSAPLCSRLDARSRPLLSPDPNLRVDECAQTSVREALQP